MTEVAKRIGSVCNIWAGKDVGTLMIERTNRWSTHDRGSSPQPIPGLGALRTSCAVTSFLIARRYGIDTHFIEQVNDTTILVREFEVPGVIPLSGKVHGRFIPLEHLHRSVVSKKLIPRVAKGEVALGELGFDEGTELVEGMDLPHLFHECTTKLEKVDRYLADGEACNIGGISHELLAAMRAIIGRVVCATTIAMEKAGYKNLDGKIEMALTQDGRPVIVDCFATPDENRIKSIATSFWHCKEIIRLRLETDPWFTELQKAKKQHKDDKSKWPSYPNLPEEFLQSVINRYASFAADYKLAAGV